MPWLLMLGYSCAGFVLTIPTGVIGRRRACGGGAGRIGDGGVRGKVSWLFMWRIGKMPRGCKSVFLCFVDQYRDSVT